MRCVALFTAVLLLGATSVASAQTDCLQEMKLQQTKLPQPGTWAEYKIVFQQQEPHTMRWAVLGTETRDGKELQWFETRMTGTRKDQNLITQVLLPRSMSSLADLDQVQEVVFKQGDTPAMKMNAMMMNMMRGKLEQQSFLSKACEGVTLVGQESVTVPAGTFEASHFRSAQQGDSWMSPAIPFSMIKMIGKDFEMELTSQGEGAKSSITETPQEMGEMGGPPSTR